MFILCCHVIQNYLIIYCVSVMLSMYMNRFDLIRVIMYAYVYICISMIESNDKYNHCVLNPFAFVVTIRLAVKSSEI